MKNLVFNFKKLDIGQFLFCLVCFSMGVQFSVALLELIL